MLHILLPRKLQFSVLYEKLLNKQITCDAMWEAQTHTTLSGRW